jgi:hypothetical protein
MFKKLTAANYFSILGILISLSGILFGNNITDRFQKAELFYNVQDVEVKVPNRLLNLIGYKASDSVFNYYREVVIKNVRGKPSNKLKIIMNVNGEIFEKSIASIEDLTVFVKHKNTIEIKLDRLVAGADIVCQFWLKQRPGTINIRYVDDNGFNEIKNMSERRDTHYLQFSAIISLILVSIMLFYSFYLGPVLKKNTALTSQNIELQEKYDSVSSELEQLKVNQEEEEEPANVLLELEKIVRNYKKKE